MGKKNFVQTYRVIKSKFTSGDIACKVSEKSDRFESSEHFLGLLVYGVDGQWHWPSDDSHTRGSSDQSLCLFIVEAKRFLPECESELAHSLLLKSLFGHKVNQEKVLCAGFAYKQGELKFGDFMVNMTSQKSLESSYDTSDGTMVMSVPEQELVRFCWQQYQNFGPGALFKISKDVEQKILQQQDTQLVDISSDDKTEPETEESNVKSRRHNKAKDQGTAIWQTGVQRPGNKYRYEANPLQSDLIRYRFYKITNESPPHESPLTFADLIEIYKSDDNCKQFTETLILALKEANRKLKAYLWECPPVTNRSIGDQQFEFVVNQSKRLATIRQNGSDFQEHFKRNRNQLACSFTNLGGDATLVVPLPKLDPGVFGDHLDYKNISNFTENASLEQQISLWKRVTTELSQCLRSGQPKWLSTNGMAVHYLHIRLDDRPKYYSFDEYRQFK